MSEDDRQLVTGTDCLFLRSPMDTHCTKYTNYSPNRHLSASSWLSVLVTVNGKQLIGRKIQFFKCILEFHHLHFKFPKGGSTLNF